MPRSKPIIGAPGSVEYVQVGDEMIEVEVSSGNVFADGGLPDAEIALARAKLMWRVTSILEERHLTRAKAAEILDISRSRAADLLGGKLGKFSLGRLIQFLNALDYDVEITVKRRPARSRQPARVVVAGD